MQYSSISLLCFSKIIMSSISEQPKGCDSCKVFPCMLTFKTCSVWGEAMDSHSFNDGSGCACGEWLCGCLPITLAIDTVACPFFTPVWMIRKIVKYCQLKNNNEQGAPVEGGKQEPHQPV